MIELGLGLLDLGFGLLGFGVLRGDLLRSGLSIFLRRLRLHHAFVSHADSVLGGLLAGE